jgi:hypothetical protein
MNGRMCFGKLMACDSRHNVGVIWQLNARYRRPYGSKPRQASYLLALASKSIHRVSRAKPSTHDPHTL